jgi:hypothetical protein
VESQSEAARIAQEARLAQQRAEAERKEVRQRSKLAQIEAAIHKKGQGARSATSSSNGSASGSGRVGVGPRGDRHRGAELDNDEFKYADMMTQTCDKTTEFDAKKHRKADISGQRIGAGDVDNNNSDDECNLTDAMAQTSRGNKSAPGGNRGASNTTTTTTSTTINRSSKRDNKARSKRSVVSEKFLKLITYQDEK